MRSRIASEVASSSGRQELVQRRVEEPDRHRQPGHRLEDPLEVGLLDRQEPFERRAPLLLVAGEDHLPHDRQPLLGHEHVLGAAEADALGAELARLRRVLGRVGVRAHAAGGGRRRPTRGSSRSSRRSRAGRAGRAPTITAPGAAVDRDHVALVRARARRPSPCRAAHVDRERLAAGDARLAHSARDDGRVRGHAAVRREDARVRWIRPWMSSGVVSQRTRITSSPVPCRAPPPCRRRRRSRRTRRRARRSGPVAATSTFASRVDHRVQELVELARVDAGDGLLARDEPLVDHLHRDAQRRRGRPLPRARLQEVERRPPRP